MLLSRLVAAWLRLLLGIVEWLHARTVGPIVDWLDESVLAASEESIKLFVRECFVSAKRLINGFCAHLLGMFDAQYREGLKLTWQQKEAWHSWWREERTSTLNAVLAAQAPAAAAGTADAAHPPARASSFRQRRTVAFSTAATAGSSKAAAGAKAAAAGTAAAGGSSRHPSHIRWQSDTAPQQLDSISSSSSCLRSPFPSHSRSAFASDGGAAAAAAAATKDPPPATAGVSSSSWLARAVWWALVGLQGRAKTPALVAAAATGHSTNPLETLPSLPSMSSLVTLPSLGSLNPWGSGGTVNPVEGLSQQQQDSAPLQQHHHLHPASSSSSSSAGRQRGHQQQQQQQEVGVVELSLLQRVRSSIAHKVRCMVTLALLPFVAPVLPGLWLLGWLWGRTKSAGSTAAADAAIADAASVQATGVAPSGLRRSSSANNSGTSGSSARQGWGFRRTSSCGVGGAAAGSAAAAAAAQQQEQQQRGFGRVGAPKRPRQQQQQQRGGSAGPMRSIVFEEAAAFGGQESSRRRGLLEELSVTMELLVTAVFEALRWVVRALTLTRRQQHPTAARQRRLAAAAAAAAAAADGDTQHIGGGGSGVADGGLSSSSSGLWFGRRSSSGGGSSSCRSRPGSPVAGVKQGGPHAHSPFGAAAFGGSGSNDDGSAEGSDGGGGAVAGMFRALSPHMDPGEEIGMQASVQQQQRHQHHHRQHSSSMLSSRSSSGGSIGSFYSGVSSSSSRSSSSAGSEVGGEEELLWGVGEAPTGLLRSKSVGGDLAEFRKGTGGGSSALPRLTLRRVRSVGRWNHQSSSGDSTGGGSGSSGRQPWLDDSELTAAAQCIMSAGYPLEIHTVTTADGVVLQMERIPRPGCARVSFFLHGILDTSLTWVSSGVTGSQAFAAWDQGFDVWLGSSRSNAPRISRDPSKKGLRYFSFSLNELGIHDIPAQLDHLHTVKMRELAGSSLRSHGGTAPTPAAAAAAPGPSSSAAAAAGLRVDVHGLDPWLTSEQQGDPQHAADSEAVFARAAAASPSLQQQQQQAGVCLQQQQQRAAGWFSPLASSSMKRTLSDPNLLPRRGDREGGSPPAAAAPLGQVQELSQGGQEKRRGGVLGAAGRLLRGAVRGGRRQQQQQPQASQPDSQQQQQQWQTAAAVAAVVSAAAASAAATAAVAAATAASGSSSGGGSLAEQQQQVQEGGRPGFRVPLLTQGLGAHPLEVNEPSTPELIESPRRPEDGCSDGGTAAAAAAVAAVAGALSPKQQQQEQRELFQAVQEEEDSPFTAAGEADAAIAAAEAACAPRCSSSGGGSGSNGDGWHSPRQSAVPRLRSTGSYGTAVDSRQQKSRRGQHQQSQQQSPRSCGMSSSAPGAPHNQQQQQGGGGASNSSRSTPGAPPRTAAAAGAASATAATATELYDLRVVAHSLGGCSMLVFCVMRAAAGLPHRVRRLVLLSPAGFHDVIPWAWWPFIFVLPYWHKLLVLLLGKERAYHPALLPTYTARGFFFNALLELARLPAMADLARAVMSGFFGGDASQWERALIMPHYSAAGMPACSLHQALHFIQIIHTGRFQLFDYGSPAENMARYGTPRPPDIASQYWRLSNLPVQLMAGSHDGIVPPVNVQKHYRAMSAAGMKVTYRELPYGHMDFTSLAAFSLKDEMRYHVMRALNAHN